MIALNHADEATITAALRDSAEADYARADDAALPMRLKLQFRKQAQDKRKLADDIEREGITE